MKNKLMDLNNYLFEVLERLTDDSLSEEEMQKEISRSRAVTSVAETIIHNGELALKGQRYVAEFYGADSDEGKKALPPMLEVR